MGDIRGLQLEVLEAAQRAEGMQLSLIDAAQRGDAGVVRSLVRKGADPNKAVVIGTTTTLAPLAAAISGPSDARAADVCRVLLDAGATVSDFHNAGPLTLAVLRRTPPKRRRRQKTVPPPPPPEVRTKGGAAARGRVLGRELFYGIQRGDASLLDRLDDVVLRTAAVSWTDGNRWTPLHAAAATGNVTACKRLLDLGASPHWRTAQGLDVLAVACQAGHLAVLKALHDHYQPPLPPPDDPLVPPSEVMQPPSEVTPSGPPPELVLSSVPDSHETGVPNFESGISSPHVIDAGVPTIDSGISSPEQAIEADVPSFESGIVNPEEVIDAGVPTFDSGICRPEEALEEGVAA